MRKAIVAAGTIAVLLLAGCADPSSQGEQRDPARAAAPGAPRPVADLSDWFERALPFGENHNHDTMDDHLGLSTPNFHVLGWNPLITDWHGRTSGAHLCASSVEKDGRALSITHSWDTDVSLIISDVTDPADPRKLGELVMQNTQVYDMALTPDQNYALLATSPLDAGPDAGVAPPLNRAPRVVTFRDACTGEETLVDGPEAGLPYASGLVLVDITNPRAPFIADFRNLPIFGAHSIRAYDIDGRTVLLSSVHNVVFAAGYYSFMTLEPTPAGPRIVPQSVYQLVPEDREIPATSGLHDGFIQKHPVTGALIAHLAYGPIGYATLNIDDLTQPRLLAHWKDWSVFGDAAPADPYVHEALPIEGTWDGRHYTFIGEECGGRPPNTPTCLVVAFDTTDPATPTIVGGWTLPADVSWSGRYQFSLHYLGLVDRTLFATAYHGGMWAIDVSSLEAMQRMPTIGVFLPDRESPKPRTGQTQGSTAMQALYADLDFEARPMIADVDALADGTLIVYDANTGLYTVRFDANAPAPAPMPWPLGTAP